MTIWTKFVAWFILPSAIQSGNSIFTLSVSVLVEDAPHTLFVVAL